MADTASILNLALFRCGELVPGIAGGDTYDPEMAGEEVRLAARSVVERLPVEALLSPLAESDAGAGGLASLVEVADPSDLPYASFEPDDDTAPKALRGRAVVGLPAGCLRVLRVRMSGWDAAIEPRQFVRGMDQVGSAGGDPSAYLTAHAFRPEDFPEEQGGMTGHPANRKLRMALVVGPPPTVAAVGGLGAHGVLAEMLFVPVPDPDHLPDALRDAVAWETAARLLGQDPETADAQQSAEKKAAEALATLRPRGAVLSASSDLVQRVLARLGAGHSAEDAEGVWDRGHVEEELRSAARSIVERVPTEALLTPQAGLPYSLGTLLASADGSSLPYVEYEPDDQSVPNALRGRAVLGLPADTLRVLRVRMSEWGAAVEPSRVVRGMDRAATDDAAFRATPDAPAAYLTTHSFAAEDFPEAPAGSRLRPALVLAPPGASGDLGELLYVPVPDPSHLPDGLRDAAVWEAVAALDPTRAEEAAAHVERVLASLRPDASVTTPLPDVVRRVVGRLGPAGAPATETLRLYDRGRIEEEVRSAARRVVERLPTEALLTPQAGQPYNLATLLASADGESLPYAEYDENDAASPRPLRGRAVVGLPPDCLRVLRVRMAGWEVPVRLSRFVRGKDQAATADAVFRATAARPSAYLTAHTFAPEDFPEAPEGSRLRPALVVAPHPTGGQTVAELLYVPVPDPEALPDGLRDVVAWEAVAALDESQAETARVHVERALASLRPSGADLTAEDDLTELVLARAGRVGDTRAELDPSHVREELRLVARAVVERLPIGALLSPQAGTPYNLSTLLAKAALGDLSRAAFEGTDTDAPDGLRGRVVIELPADMLRLVRVRGKGWTRYLRGERLVPTLDEPYPAEDGQGGLYPERASRAHPSAYLTAFDFGAGLRAALVLAPARSLTEQEGDPLAPGALADLEELLYVPTPDPAKLPDGLRDVVVWETVGRLSGDARASAEAFAQAERTLSTIYRPPAQVHHRRGLLI